jgi:Protein of unknown function (DUF3455)
MEETRRLKPSDSGSQPMVTAGSVQVATGRNTRLALKTIMCRPNRALGRMPSAIAAPDRLPIVTVHGEGAQIYECKADAAGTLAWQFREPIATLLLNDKTVGRHSAGPTWDSMTAVRSPAEPSPARQARHETTFPGYASMSPPTAAPANSAPPRLSSALPPKVARWPGRAAGLARSLPSPTRPIISFCADASLHALLRSVLPTRRSYAGRANPDVPPGYATPSSRGLFRTFGLATDGSCLIASTAVHRTVGHSPRRAATRLAADPVQCQLKPILTRLFPG